MQEIKDYKAKRVIVLSVYNKSTFISNLIKSILVFKFEYARVIIFTWVLKLKLKFLIDASTNKCNIILVS